MKVVEQQIGASPMKAYELGYSWDSLGRLTELRAARASMARRPPRRTRHVFHGRRHRVARPREGRRPAAARRAVPAGCARAAARARARWSAERHHEHHRLVGLARHERADAGRPDRRRRQPDGDAPRLRRPGVPGAASWSASDRADLRLATAAHAARRVRRGLAREAAAGRHRGADRARSRSPAEATMRRAKRSSGREQG